MTDAGLARVALASVASRTVARIPRPVRIPGGAWMVTWGDAAGRAIRRGDLEPDEASFVRRYLKPGMVVLDIGAHGGFYTLLARRCVGRTGRVIAFEPSPRERARLRLNLRLNRFGDVTVVSAALGERSGETQFHVVHGLETGFGGREEPAVAGRIERLVVELSTVDATARNLGIEAVDLIKVDVEGGELAVFQGASGLLDRPPRPVVLCEISDERASMWDHRGSDVFDHIEQRGFEWFVPGRGGVLSRVVKSHEFHGNFVAVPHERRAGIESLTLDA